jgi:hypothetical protein
MIWVQMGSHELHLRAFGTIFGEIFFRIYIFK